MMVRTCRSSLSLGLLACAWLWLSAAPPAAANNDKNKQFDNILTARWLLREWLSDPQVGGQVSDKIDVHEQGYLVAVEDIAQDEPLATIPSNAIYVSEAAVDYVDDHQVNGFDDEDEDDEDNSGGGDALSMDCQVALDLVSTYDEWSEAVAEQNDAEEEETGVQRKMPILYPFVSYLLDASPLPSLSTSLSSAATGLPPPRDWSSQSKEFVQEWLVGNELEPRDFGEDQSVWGGSYARECKADKDYDDYPRELQKLLHKALYLVRYKSWGSDRDGRVAFVPLLNMLADLEDDQDAEANIRATVNDTLVAARDIPEGELLWMPGQTKGRTASSVDSDDEEPHWGTMSTSTYFALYGSVPPLPHHFKFRAAGYGRFQVSIDEDLQLAFRRTTGLEDGDDDETPSFQQMNWILAHRHVLHLPEISVWWEGNHTDEITAHEKTAIAEYHQALTRALDLLASRFPPRGGAATGVLEGSETKIAGNASVSGGASGAAESSSSFSEPDYGHSVGSIPSESAAGVSVGAQVVSVDGSGEVRNPEILIGGTAESQTASSLENLPNLTMLGTETVKTATPLQQYHFDDLKDRFHADDMALPYKEMRSSRTCYNPRIYSLSADEGAVSEHLQSKYQGLEWAHFPNDHFDEDEEDDGAASGPSDFDTCLFLDGIEHSCMALRPHVHETIVHYPASFLEKVERVLFVGGGDLVLLHEIMKYNETLELVVGMELDQVVVRSSFRHYGIQPNFESDKVQWWFGDASKSLAMLPEEYLQSFDLVVIDLLSFLFDTLKVEGERIMDFAVKKLLKPDTGILVRQEDFVKHNYVRWAKHTVDLDIFGLPYLCFQSFSMGSNGVDFTKAKRYEHANIPTVLEPPGNYTLWSGTRTTLDYNASSTEGAAPTNKYGVLLILEVEDVKSDLEANIEQTIGTAMEAAGLATLSVHRSHKGDHAGDHQELILVLQQGYVVARLFPSQNYCGVDVMLWNDSASKLESTKQALLAAIGREGSNTASSSFRIIAGGMLEGSKTKATPAAAESSTVSAEKESGIQADVIGAAVAGALLSEMAVSLSTPQSNASALVVVCGDQSTPCSSLESVADGPSQVVPLWACPSLSAAGGDGGDIVTRLLNCERVSQGSLQRDLKDERIRAIVIDASAPREMGQVLHKIFNHTAARHELLAEEFVILASSDGTTEGEEEWKSALMERFRTHISPFRPSFHSTVALQNRDGSRIEVELFSAGDMDFYSHLIETMERVVQLQPQFVSWQLVNSRVGLVGHVPDYEPTRAALHSDYDLTDSRRQFLEQQPLGQQYIFQFDVLPQREIRVGAPILINNHVHPWRGTWAPGRLVAVGVDDDGVAKYKVSYDDEGLNGSTIVTREQIREITDHVLTAPLEFGEWILMGFIDTANPALSTWFQGAILNVNEDGTYHVVCFDGDGDEYQMERGEMIKFAEQPPPSSDATPASLSSARLESVLKTFLNTTSSSNNNTKTDKEEGVLVTRVGDGCVAVALFGANSIVATWDGRAHLEVNLFVNEQVDETIIPDILGHDLEGAFLQEIPNLALTQLESQPRGTNRVVNSRQELHSGDAEYEPIWFGNAGELVRESAGFLDEPTDDNLQ